ncbi:Homeodomain-like protein [Kickxella alabastrina]|uniref:Homeodomain-like protein n=1 Tax=Kickxella alabastrina TaxID=61397 RepID=UPI00221E974F|nr:Homeodomain-like protein [Kickxella alabastrina]KAI7832012.1 Homeodomain-like protein [Kickxella alabastrina]
MDSPATSASSVGSAGSSPQPRNFPVGTGQYTYDELSQEIFNLKPAMATCSVRWNKAAPMDVTKFAMAEYLSQAERDCCSVLRLYPEQYLMIKQSLVRAGRNLPPGTFKKRDAQKLCRVDVNKTSKVFEWFCKLGWIPQVASRAHINYNYIGDNSNRNSDSIKVDNKNN